MHPHMLGGRCFSSLRSGSTARRSAARCQRSAPRGGFTLVEIMVATALTLLMMGMVVTIFALVSENVTDSRATIEMSSRLRTTGDRLRLDLEGVTAPMSTPPPHQPENHGGYLEIIEGPIGPVVPPHLAGSCDVDRLDNSSGATGRDGFLDPDTTLGDTDDVLMFTVRSRGAPFVGAGGDFATPTRPGVLQSQLAEVCWFVRGNTLYRRVLLIIPQPPASPPPVTDFYSQNDLSVRMEGGRFDRTRPGLEPRLVANSLADLTRRENRYGHQPYVFPYDARFWGRLGLPTLAECSYTLGPPTARVGQWPFPLRDLDVINTAWDTPPYVPLQSPEFTTDPYAQLILPYVTRNPSTGAPQNAATLNPDWVPPSATFPNTVSMLELSPRWTNLPPTGAKPFDAWRTPHPWDQVDRVTGRLPAYTGPPGISVRTEDDVILTNVLSFDVKVWDPAAPLFRRADSRSIGGTPAWTLVAPGDAGYIRDCYLPFLAGETFVELRGFGAYVDLNYLCLAADGSGNIPLIPGVPSSLFYGRGNPFSRLAGRAPFNVAPSWSHADWDDPTAFPVLPQTAAVYDTGSFHYEHDGIDQDGDGIVDEATNSLDDDGAGGVDDAGELEAPPPYAWPLRGIQVKIRVFEPDSRQIRELTIVQEFLPE